MAYVARIFGFNVQLLKTIHGTKKQGSSGSLTCISEIFDFTVYDTHV